MEDSAKAKARSPRKFWNFRAAADSPQIGELMLYGLIGPDDGMGWLFDEMSPKQFKADLDALGNISELRVFINSEGGDVFAGQAIHSILKRHKAKIIVHIDGLAASIASVVAMAGDVVIMPRNAMMMIHNPFAATIGDADRHRKQAETLDQVRESIVAAYQDKTGMDRQKLIDLLDAETWMTATEAVGMGFADEVAEAEQIAASLVAPGVALVNGHYIDLSRFINPPAFSDAGSKVSDAYTTQASAVVASVSEFAARTTTRQAQREKAGRALSEADIARWREIEDVAGRVLEHVAPKPEAVDGMRLFLAHEKTRAALNGVPI